MRQESNHRMNSGEKDSLKISNSRAMGVIVLIALLFLFQVVTFVVQKVRVRQVAEVRLLSILGWSVDPRDWATTDTISIERAVLGNIKDGDIILLHDMSASSVMAALDIIDSLQKEGFRFVTVSQLAKIRHVRLKPGVTYNCFPPEEVK